MTQDFTVKFPSKIEMLTEGQWVWWSCEFRMSLRAQKAWKYVDSTSTRPTDTILLTAWLEANDQIVSTLGGIVDASLQRELESITVAAIAWKKLKEKTQSTGIIAKLESMQSAIRNRFTTEVPFSTTITEICDSLTAVFDKSAPTTDDWLIILLLNALSDRSFDWLWKDLITFMTNSKVQLSVKDIIERIEAEAREVRDVTKREDTTLTSRSTKGKTPQKQKTKCSTCQKTSHTMETCWKGKDSLKAPDWFKKKNKGGEKVNTAGTDSGSELQAVWAICSIIFVLMSTK
ncbi:hypothetical protein K439DRAFT_1611347 [Ramaria rubella]|nr:hypothetical protein K439DRAFT_1611347 [Ramaria rubella]